MEKKLAEMTLEELWQLFPITLTPHQACWAQWYREEAAALGPLLPLCTLHHIGSTAVPGIWAKPIIDILAVAPRQIGLPPLRDALTAQGWLCMSQAPARVSLNKGYTPQGFAQRVFHLHLRLEGDWDELLFRDYLLAHPDTAKEYERLKLSLWKPYEHDRDGYTNAKAPFVGRVMALAKAAR